MKSKILLAMFSILSSLALAQDFSELEQKTEREACEAIKQQTYTQSGICAITTWTDLSYVIEYRLSGNRVIDAKDKSSLRASPTPIGSTFELRRWTRTKWNYTLTGKTSCNLDPNANRWSCSSSVDPFEAAGESSKCSCQPQGFAGCAATTHCAQSWPVQTNGLTLIDQGSVSRVITDYNETHLYH